MIKVERPAGSIPDGLARKGAAELRKNRQALKDDPDAKLNFDVYSGPTVKAALNKMFARKCAFCESFLLGTQPGDVEHFRPKGTVVCIDPVTSVKTNLRGYYWLGAKWSNLLLSCADCNRPRTQPDADGDNRVIGKSAYFPVLDEAARATGPGKLSGEVALLLNPCSDDPSEHLVLREDGVIEPRQIAGAESERGLATIKYCGLSRLELLQARARHKRFAMAAIRHTIAALEEGRDPGADLDDLLSLLDVRDGQYVAFTRMLVKKHMSPYLKTLNLDPFD